MLTVYLIAEGQHKHFILGQPNSQQRAGNLFLFGCQSTARPYANMLTLAWDKVHLLKLVWSNANKP